MSLSFKNAGINITSEKLQIIEVLGENEKFVVENIDEEFFGEILNFNDKEPKIINILQNAFDEINLRHKLIAADVSFTLPPNKFKIFEIPFEVSLTKKDLRRHIRWEFNQLFPGEEENAFLIREIKIVNNNLRTDPMLIIVAVRKNYLQILHKFSLRNKLNLRFIDHAHLAASNVLRGIKKKDSEVNFSLYISDKSFSVVLLDDNYPIYFKNYSVDNILQVIEKLKTAVEVIEKLGIPMSTEKRGYIAGDNITDTFLQQIKEELDITFIKINPFSVIKVKHELEESELYALKYNAFTAALGISLRLG